MRERRRGAKARGDGRPAARGLASRPLAAAAVVSVATALFMICYESLKELFLPGLSKWGSHAVTIAVSGLFSGLAALIALGRFHSVNEELRVEVLERRKAENEASRALEERNALFRELQHRVKNSFMMISSLIRLSRDGGPADDPGTVLEEVDDRVQAISEMYDLLYSTGSTDQVDLDSYLARILGLLARDPRIEVCIDLSAGKAATGAAVNIGLIVTEFMTNAIKHAFPGGRSGTVELSVSAAGDDLRIVFADDGVGMRPGIDPAASRSIGLTIVRSLIEQLDGSYVVSSSAGTTWDIRVPMSRLRPGDPARGPLRA